MTSKQSAVLWLGLLLILTRLLTTGQGRELWGTVKTSDSSASGSANVPGVNVGNGHTIYPTTPQQGGSYLA